VLFPEPTLTRLLGSIEANRLVLVCGAGLSMSPPSNLMSAMKVAEACYDKYQATKVLPPELRQDIDGLAGYFYARSIAEFESVFLGSLVPWNELVGEPNTGHAAVGDFLTSRAAVAALSANFDNLIEQWATSHKNAMRGALTGQEAANASFSANANPLLKFHGCLNLDREKTLWTAGQLDDPAVKNRVESCTKWMELNLPGKDLLVIGFWSDWGYLNEVLAKALAVKNFGSVTVVDPKTADELAAKAPQLWTTLSTGTAMFQHVPGSGAEALEELRVAFSRVWLRKFYALAKTLVEAEGKAYGILDPEMPCDDLYDCRRDAEGVPNNRAAQEREPPPHAAQAAFFHHLMHHAGKAREGSWYRCGDKRVRVVQGAGQSLNTVKEKFKESPALMQPDIVVCAGAIDIPVPARLISTGRGESVVRPQSGGSAHWMTDAQARVELGLGGQQNDGATARSVA
jgi:hypothetical protein